ncbi:hypothetical protein Thiowin_04418 [Thiorhodovibrio winogradskyi]|uniref:DUF4124 domain-containing protein n=1 Tax=Thiorhodovibrio winogradskyi TaxID=77007 RepID=A0ABZ0SGX9_9GAMM|nr:DUF4124 domain-containing protein [Thiorhodovibrio winogradskyi]
MSHDPGCFFAQSLALILAGTIALAMPAAAQQQVYRSVDAQGRVSFSAEPPAGEDVRSIESIELQPGPSEADRQAAEARVRDMQQAADAYEQQRQSAREAETGQEESGNTSKSPSESDASPAAEQWNQLLVNDRRLTPEQRKKVEEAKRELLEAQQRGRQSAGGGDLYKRPDNYQHSTPSRSERD